MSELDNLVGAAKAAEGAGTQQIGGAGASNPFGISAPKQDGGMGGGLASLAPKMPKIPTPSFGGALADQYRSILGTAYQAAQKRMREGVGGQKSNPFADMKSVFGQMPGGQGTQGAPQTQAPAQMQNIGAPTAQTPAPSNPAPQTQAAPTAQQPAVRPPVTEGRGLFGGRTRSYERNGTVVEIPQSVGADDESVGKFMDDINGMMDAMDAAYAED